MSRASGAHPPDPGDDADAPGEPGFGIEELSRRTGITVRSLRSYQSRKLLPAPEVRGRTGYYAQRHVDRIELLKDLQSEGFTLDSIANMLDATGRSDAELLRFTRSVRSMFGETDGSIVTAAELLERLDAAPERSAEVLGRAVRLGLLREVGEGTYEELAPRLVAVGEKAVRALGLDAGEALDVVTTLRRHVDRVAEVYLDLYVSRVWAPFVEAGQPRDQWAGVQQALEEVRALATEALDGAFEMVMSERIDAIFGRELIRARRADKSSRKPRR